MALIIFYLGIQPKHTIYEEDTIREWYQSDPVCEGTSRFERAKFELPFIGQNQHGDHDDRIVIHFYEPSGNYNVFNETLLKSILSTQVQPETLPGWYC